MDKSQRKTLSDRLDDLSVEDILVNLPVKSLMRFKCVSKSWKSLIEEDSSLIESHLSLSKARPPQLLISISNSILFYTPKDHHEFEGGVVLRNKVTIPWYRHAMLNPIHGLFCILDALKNVTCMFNLDTRKTTPRSQSSTPFRWGSPPITSQPTYGFGFDPSTNKYKILCVWEIPAKSVGYEGYGGMTGVDHICEVFTVGGENQWRKIHEVPPVRLYGGAVYADGSIYMRNAGSTFSSRPDNEVIVAFDVGIEKFRIIQIPNFIVGSSETLKKCGGHRRAKYLLQIDGHIALIDRVEDHVLKLWISDDSYKERKMTTNWTEETISLPSSFVKDRYIELHPVQGTDEIIIPSHTPDYHDPRDFLSLYIYNRSKKSFQMIDVTGISPLLHYPYGYYLYIHHESLVPVIQKPASEEMPDQPSYTSLKMEKDASQVVGMDFEYYY
ncbi:hypothetical protein MKX03_030453 [Papaver bracteatum]|nr:hypothetical protein MKX03_030453 [Papaver bracteatum]